MPQRRIYVGRLFQEGNSFSPLPTDLQNFVIQSGDQLVADAVQSSSSLGGGVRSLLDAGVGLCPGVSAIAPPGGPVIDAAYVYLREKMVASAKAARADAVFLDLHGAMATQGIDDAEGDLLALLRSELGPNTPIAVALDLHAHPTPRMLDAIDICVACKENPHTDYAAAGARAAQLLLRLLAGDIRPVIAFVSLPLIIGARLDTGEGPLAELHAMRRRASETPGILDISIYNTIPFLDARDAGQSVTVTTDNDGNAAATAALELAQAIWERRYAFTPNLPSLDETLTLAASAARDAKPFVLGDQGDRVLAGAPGDGTLILSEIMKKWPRLRAVVPVTDPAAVKAATAAGVGGCVHLAVGNAFSGNPGVVESDWSVARLSDGRFVQRGPYLAGERADLGATAVLNSRNVTVMATSQPGFTQDPEAFISNGIELHEYDIVVTKSGFHFKISFASIGTCIVVDTPGLSNYAPGLLPYRRRRPCFPEDAIESPRLQPVLFEYPGRRGGSQI